MRLLYNSSWFAFLSQVTSITLFDCLLYQSAGKDLYSTSMGGEGPACSPGVGMVISRATPQDTLMA